MKFLTRRGGDIYAKSSETGNCALDYAEDMRMSRENLQSLRAQYLRGLVDALCEVLAHKRDIRHIARQLVAELEALPQDRETVDHLQ